MAVKALPLNKLFLVNTDLPVIWDWLLSVVVSLSDTLACYDVIPRDQPWGVKTWDRSYLIYPSSRFQLGKNIKLNRKFRRYSKSAKQFPFPDVKSLRTVFFSSSFSRQFHSSL